MGRWTQQDEDSTRLPPGVKRIAYDADAARYTFCDEEGNLYLGPPHEEYGVLTMVKRGTGIKNVEQDRPGAFADKGMKLEVVPHGNSDGSTFHDFVPAHLITSPSSSADSPSNSPNSNPQSRFRDAARRTGMPAMQSVVNGLRRSVTSARRPKGESPLG
ncbi:hypothetical protein C8F01DRAFT_940229, partial [Mycena amicta]